MVMFGMLFAMAQAGNNPLTKLYIENRGQVKDENGRNVNCALFYNSGHNTQLIVTTTGYTIVYRQTAFSGTVYNKIEFELNGASINKDNVVFITSKAADINCYHGDQKQEGIKSTSTVLIRNIYPGIDWVWSFDATGKPKHEFMVNLGANANQVK
mgnify:CR=1 FL=1